MRITHHKIRLTLATLLASATSLLTGCYEESIAEESAADKKNHQAYIALNFKAATNVSTRSTSSPPRGGEWGDGREMGQEYENIVTTAALFLYQDAKGVNGNASTPITMVYFDIVNGNQNTSHDIDYIATTTPQPVDLNAGHYDILAIANPCDLSWAEGSLTLGVVRDHIESIAWMEEINGDEKTYSSFVMSSENESEGVDITENSTREEPDNAEVEVERMAARIDYQASGTFTINEDANGEVTGDGDSNYTGAIVEITGAAIVNNLTAGSYLLKRTNNGIGTPVAYLGDEHSDAGGVATNYVIDPWTEEKIGGEYVTIDGVSSPVSSLYGVYYPGNATSEEQDPSYWAGIMKKGTAVTADGETWNRIGYTMENTTYADYTSKKYSTAVVFGATFTPAAGTVVDTFYEDFSYTDGKTFFKWNNILYATAEDMMAVAYPRTFNADDMFGATTFSSITTLEELQAFAATLRDDDPTGYKAYLETVTEFPTDKTSLYWVNYMSNVCSYTFDTTSGVNVGEKTRATLATTTDGAVSTYEDAQCYYTWWVRHSNDDSDETNGTMEYAIVRNNIYKLRVTSVYSIGGDIPKEGLQVEVYVKDWTMFDEETIDL